MNRAVEGGVTIPSYTVKLVVKAELTTASLELMKTLAAVYQLARR
jgi:hypothetical protein